MQKMKMRDLSNNLTLAEGQDEYIRDCKVRNLRAGTIRHWTDYFTNMCHYISPDTLISDFDENTMPEFMHKHISLKKTKRNMKSDPSESMVDRFLRVTEYT